MNGDTLAQQNFQFEFNWKLTLFTLLLLPLLIRLGFWQLSRAEEKRLLQDTQLAQQALPPVDYSPSAIPADFRLVRAEGQFDTQHYWLLEGRHYNGKLGYEVLMPLQLAKGWLLVNRGWVPAGKYREDNPQITTPSGQIQVTGSLVTPSDSPLINHKDQQQHIVQWPPRILEIDIELLNHHYATTLSDTAPTRPSIFTNKVLHISAENEAAFAVEWRSINMSPQKHTAYAVQWFSMALALMVLWLFASSNLSQLIAAPRNNT